MVKFLIVRFSSIGDIVLTTPLVRILKEQVEGAEIHYLTKKQNVQVIQANPHIHTIHSFDNNLKELIEELKYLHFDYVIDLHNNLRSGRIKSSLHMPNFSFNKLNWEKWLMVNLKINKLPDVHIVDRILETISVFDTKNDKLGLDYFISKEEEVDLASLPESYQQGYVGFVIGAQHATKKLSNAKIAEICSAIHKPILLLGGPDDDVNAKEVLEKTTGTVLNTCGKYKLNQSASLVKQANVIISHDTGLMHIAAAYKKKIVSVWGNTIPEFGMYPYLPADGSVIAEVKGLKCRPCTKIGFSRCPKKHFDCMEKQDVSSIVNALQELY